MNVNEGMRRLALVAGFLGLIAGAFASHVALLDFRREIAGDKEFESLVTSDAFNKQIQHLHPWDEYRALDEGVSVRVLPPDRDYAKPYWSSSYLEGKEVRTSTVPINAGGVKSVTWANVGDDFRILDIETQRGRKLYNFGHSHWLYLLYSSLPVFGFLVPWGAIRTVGWVILGFQKH